MDVKPCVGCGREIPDFARVCEHCGHREVDQRQPSLELSFDEAPDAASEPDAFHFSVEKASEPARPEAFKFSLDSFPESARSEAFEFSLENSSEPARPVATEDTPAPVPVRSRRRELTMITAAVVIGGAFTFAVLLARAAPSTETGAAPVAAPPVKAAVPAASTHTPGWTTGNSAVWAGHERNSAAFELQAENTVPIWMRSVRPMLVVRCVSGSVEAFVFTASAARIEPQTNDHTVRFSFDGGADVTEPWADSEEHDALFAPDGASFARRVVAARVLRFGFTPHNAAPVTAEFQVAGLAELIATSARECGWQK